MSFSRKSVVKIIGHFVVHFGISNIWFSSFSVLSSFLRTFVHQLLSRYYHENMFVSIGKIVNIFAHEKGRSPERPNPRKYLVLLHFSPILVRHLSDFSPALVGDKTGMRVTVLQILFYIELLISSHVGGGVCALYMFPRMSSVSFLEYSVSPYDCVFNTH